MEINFSETKVLLVDDDENYGFALKTMLGSKGLQIDSNTNPREALEYLKNNHVDIILLDYYMPEMTGEEFLGQLRQFDETTVVFLQTAYSEEKPELEMLDNLNIQGYIDKNKEPEEIFLEIVSGIKMVELIRVIKEKENEIQRLHYRKAITGNLITNLVNESKDQLMLISGMNEAIKNASNDFETETSGIKNAVSKMGKLYNALNFEYVKEMNIEELKEIVFILLRPTLLISNSTLDFEESESITITNPSETIYTLIEVAKILTKEGNNNIKVKILDENGKRRIKVFARDIEKHNFNDLKLLTNLVQVDDEALSIEL